MNINSEKKFSWHIILLTMPIGIGIGVVFSALILVPTLMKTDITGYEIFSIITNFSMLITAISAIGFTLFSIKTQRKQWLNDAFIKHEADVLLEFKKEFNKTISSRSFIIHNILSIKKHSLETNPPLPLKREKVVYCFNQICYLNELYNNNQHIFRKHNLEKKISTLTLLLSSLASFPQKDLQYFQRKKTNTYTSYYLENFDEVIRSFILLAQDLYDREENEIISIEELNKKLRKDPIKELNRLKGLINKNLTELEFDLDSLTLFTDGLKNKKLLVKKSKFYQPLDS